MARFRLVELGDNDKVIKELYRSPMYPGDEWNKDFQKDNYNCLIEFNEVFDFIDYDNCPLLEFQITTDDKEWTFLSSPIEDYFNL